MRILVSAHLRICGYQWRNKMIISERIFKILKDKNISQNAFAQQIGLASSTISDWKTKKTNPSSDKIMDICIALNITPEQLLTGKDIDDDIFTTKVNENSSNPEFSKSDIKILKEIHELKETQRKRLIKYIEVLKQLDNLEDLK